MPLSTPPFRKTRRPCLLAALALAAAPATAHGLSLSPLDGTPDASPQTQISILGAAPSQITAVSVTGSRSGRHTGKLESYSANDGASFVLDAPLTQGEKVRASATVAGHTRKWSFTVAHIGVVPPPPVPTGRPMFDFAVLDAFKSAPNLLAPKITINKTSPAAAPGDLLITPAPVPPVPPNQPPNPKLAPKVIGPGGPMIVDGQGNLIWFHLIPQTPGTAPIIAANLKPVTYQGQPALSWWQGHINPLGFGVDGQETIVDRNYKQLAAIKAGNGYSVDAHDFALTPGGDGLVCVYTPVIANLESVHGPHRAVILDSIFQQVDGKTGLVKYEWHSYGHVSIGDSYNKPIAVGFDPWHLNSLQLLPNNRILISDRNTWAAYNIDLTTGRVIWTLGGRHSTFKMGKGAQFAFQHDIQLRPGNTVTVYDDEAGPPVVRNQSRGLELALDLAHHRATVRHQYIRPGVLVGSQGDMQTLPNGDKLVGWGASQFISEFSSTGQLIFDAQMPTGDDSYRAYRIPWVGTPDPAASPPALAATGSGGSYTLYASWNGATEVASWQVLAGSSPGALAAAGNPVPRTGFETTIPISTTAAYVAVQALNANGQLLGTSAAMAP